VKRFRPIAIKVVLVLAVLYVAASAGLYWVMRQPPEVFGGVMRYVPMPMMVLPFKPLWLRARAGHLKVGDAAPDFALATYDKKSSVQLSYLRGQKPVVLVFGSYT
jgi:hypothetical protein